MIIEMDDREPEMQLLSDLNNFGLQFDRKRLKVGDFVYKDLIIERKQIDDFCSSILDGRIERQIENMKKCGKKSFIIIVGCIKDRKSNIHENCILGKCVSLVLNHGMKIIWCENELQFLYVLKNLCSKYDKEVHNEKEFRNYV